MGQVRVADLPVVTNVHPESYVIIERPGVGNGTFKATVRDLQQAIRCLASVKRQANIVRITIDDMNGHTEQDIFYPTARIVDNGDGTVTITLSDESGVTTQTVFSVAAGVDPEPQEDSPHIVTSGTVYNVQQNLQEQINSLQAQVTALQDRIAEIERTYPTT